jgi:hypothetical protein
VHILGPYRHSQKRGSATKEIISFVHKPLVYLIFLWVNIKYMSGLSTNGIISFAADPLFWLCLTAYWWIRVTNNYRIDIQRKNTVTIITSNININYRFVAFCSLCFIIVLLWLVTFGCKCGGKAGNIDGTASSLKTRFQLHPDCTKLVDSKWSEQIIERSFGTKSRRFIAKIHFLHKSGFFIGNLWKS